MSWVCEVCNKDYEVQMMGVIGSFKTNYCGEYEDFELLCYECLKNKFSEIISTMNIPEKRKNDYQWIKENIGVFGGNHSNYQQAIFYLKAIFNQM